ncbi:hypothetical protein [Limobrevibacterium gyesilva]|uniref:Uncharacterized protein n=1 Tax=Limobrevibacterium gyesilva TaxID=2991712 RepID=A0AA41YPS8_9PROT|nr:hypothetical protein [Limobrevibacterium gyesilva]MCW3477831.1 hypothetical protein [Limobrevibacterium gyesilva]
MLSTPLNRVLLQTDPAEQATLTMDAPDFAPPPGKLRARREI